jgi:uncharacterized tellurite resistance protein B-like protein
MFQRVKAWLLDGPRQAAEPQRRHEEHEIACAALLVEAACADGHFDEVERSTILRLLVRRFELSDAEAHSLLAVAQARQAQANEVFKFALAARQAFDEEERVGLIEMLWTTILSDGEVHDFEGSLMRRIAGLLHVPDKAAGEARKRAASKLAQAQSGQGDEA